MRPRRNVDGLAVQLRGTALLPNEGHARRLRLPVRPYHRPKPKPAHPERGRPPAMWYQDDFHQPVGTSRLRTNAKDLRHRGDDVPAEAVDTGRLAADHNGYRPRSHQRLGDEGKIG